MSDTVFTPDSRHGMIDPVLIRPGARTESISLADEAEYRLGGERQDGATRIASKLGQPFEGTFDVMFREDQAKQRYRVKKNDIVATAWAIASNVVTVTLASNHRLKTGQWVSLGLFPSGTVFEDAALGVAVQIIDVSDLSFTGNLTAGNESTVTEAFTVIKSDVLLQMGEGEQIFSGTLASDEDITLGPLRAGRYRLVSPGTTVHDNWYVSDGSTIDMVVEGTTIADVTASVVYASADSATLQALFLSGSDLRLTNGAGVSTTIRVEYYSDEFDDVDVNGRMCFFEKIGDLFIKNRTGAAVTDIAIESVRTRVAGRIASSASLLPAEHPQA